MRPTVCLAAPTLRPTWTSPPSVVMAGADESELQPALGLVHGCRRNAWRLGPFGGKGCAQAVHHQPAP